MPCFVKHGEVTLRTWRAVQCGLAQTQFTFVETFAGTVYLVFRNVRNFMPLSAECVHSFSVCQMINARYEGTVLNEIDRIPGST